MAIEINENNSLRGELIKKITETFCIKILFELFEGSEWLEKKLQKELSSHLSFETKVYDVSYSEGSSVASGRVTFLDEKGTRRVVNFSIIRSGEIATF